MYCGGSRNTVLRIKSPRRIGRLRPLCHDTKEAPGTLIGSSTASSATNWIAGRLGGRILLFSLPCYAATFIIRPLIGGTRQPPRKDANPHMADILGTENNFKSLSIRDLLYARDLYHYHLMNKA